MTDPTAFIAVRFVGPRFETGRLAVAAMPELIAYERLILDAAKQIYLEDHQGRRRVPAGFGRSFALNVTEVRSGSNVAVLSLTGEAVEGQLPLAGVGDYFERARDRINAVIASAGSGTIDLIKAAPTQLLRLFGRFGSSLGNDDAMELAALGSAIPAVPVVRYDRTVRRRINTAASDEYEDDHEDIGFIEEADRRNDTFRFASVEGRRIDGTISLRANLMDDVAAALSTQEYVRIRGTATHDHRSRIRAFRLTDIDLLGAPKVDFERRLVDLGLVTDGWMDGEGAGIEASTLRGARTILRALVWDHGFAAPYLYPAEDGGIRAEWTEDDAEVSLEITDAVTLHVLSLSTDEERTGTWPLERPEQATDVIAQLHRALHGIVTRNGDVNGTK